MIQHGNIRRVRVLGDYWVVTAGFPGVDAESRLAIDRRHRPKKPVIGLMLVTDHPIGLNRRCGSIYIGGAKIVPTEDVDRIPDLRPVYGVIADNSEVLSVIEASNKVTVAGEIDLTGYRMIVLSTGDRLLVSPMTSPGQAPLNVGDRLLTEICPLSVQDDGMNAGAPVDPFGRVIGVRLTGTPNHAEGQ